MDGWKRVGTKSLAPSALSNILLITLCIFSLLALASASNCPWTSGSNHITCKCDNGQRETYTNNEDFHKARKDPSSCCYYKPSKRETIPSIPTQSPNYRDNYIINEVPDAEDSSQPPTQQPQQSLQNTAFVLTEEDIAKAKSQNTNKLPNSPPLEPNTLTAPNVTSTSELPPAPVHSVQGFIITPSTPDYSKYPPNLQAILQLFGISFL
jgi:hypothetical protein